MLVVIKFGYSKYVFPQEVIPLLGNIREVEEKSVGGKTKYFIIESAQEVTINLVQESKFVLPDTPDEQMNYKQMCEEKEKLINDLYSRVWAEEKKVSTLTVEKEALKELCPDSHKKEKPNVS